MTENTHGILFDLIRRATCKPDWSFHWDETDKRGVVFMITIYVDDSTSIDTNVRITHCFPVPTATYNEASWRRWLFERCRDVETHELGEWFKIDGVQPFPPLHGPGEDPYTVHEFRDHVDARTLQNGTVVDSL